MTGPHEAALNDDAETVLDPRADGDVYRLTGVSKIYRKGNREIPAVRDLDLEIRDGEWLAVQGETGHGKTTLLQLLGGLDRPTQGRVEFAGEDLATVGEARVRSSSRRRPAAAGQAPRQRARR